MPKRIHSPSSINTYKQCPRRYYYQYIKKLPAKPSIHTIRGSVVHTVLEKFFEMELTGIDVRDFEHACRKRLQALLKYYWEKNNEIKLLKLSPDQLMFYFEESLFMLINWFNKFNDRIKESRELGIGAAFKKLIPEREHFIHSDELSIRGFIDAIEKNDAGVRLMDYKTSKSFEISEEYKLQLSLYALLYTVKFGSPPSTVGIYFLKDPDRFEYSLKVDSGLLGYAKSEIEIMNMNTQTDTMGDYPKKPSALCKFGSGQCDFYDTCFLKKEI